MSREEKVTKSSGNIYSDLGFKDPETLKLKAGLAHQIHLIIKKRKLTQIRAAEIMGIDQPKVSKLIRGQVSGYSLERLFSFLRYLSADINVSVVVEPPKKKQAKLYKGHLYLETLAYQPNGSSGRKPAH